MEPIGENGYSGQIMRVSSIELVNPEHKCKIQSFVIKTCFIPHHPDVESEARLMFALGGLYGGEPVFPEIYLALSYIKGVDQAPLIDDPNNSFYMILMQDMGHLTTKSFDSGLTLPKLLSVTDSLAAFHVY